jgi:hypothetical protein
MREPRGKGSDEAARLITQGCQQTLEHPWLHQHVVIQVENGLGGRLSQQKIALLGNAMQRRPVVPLDAAAMLLDHPAQRLHHRVVRDRLSTLVGDDDAHVADGLRRYPAQGHHQRRQPIARRQQDVGRRHFARDRSQKMPA